MTASMCGCSVEDARVEAPHGGECRIEQADPAVAAEHRNRFGEIVEGLALDPDQRVEAALEIEPLGDVVEEIGDAAVGIGRGDDAQRAQVRQVPHERLRLGGAVGRVELRLPGAEVLLLGQPPRRPQAVEHGRIARMLVEERGSRSHRRAIGRVVEGELVVGAEYRDAGRELVERAAVRLDGARELAAQRLDLGRVAADAGAAAASGTSTTSKLRRAPATVTAAAARGDAAGAAALDLGAGRGVEQFEAGGDGARRVGRLDRARIARIDEGEPAGAVAHPHRRRQRLDQARSASVSALELLVAMREVGELALDAADVAAASARRCRRSRGLRRST